MGYWWDISPSYTNDEGLTLLPPVSAMGSKMIRLLHLLLQAILLQRNDQVFVLSMILTLSKDQNRKVIKPFSETQTETASGDNSDWTTQKSFRKSCCATSCEERVPYHPGFPGKAEFPLQDFDPQGSHHGNRYLLSNKRNIVQTNIFCTWGDVFIFQCQNHAHVQSCPRNGRFSFTGHGIGASITQDNFARVAMVQRYVQNC